MKEVATAWRTWEIQIFQVHPSIIKVIREKSRGEGSLMEQDTIENVS